MSSSPNPKLSRFYSENVPPEDPNVVQTNNIPVTMKELSQTHTNVSVSCKEITGCGNMENEVKDCADTHVKV